MANVVVFEQMYVVGNFRYTKKYNNILTVLNIER